MDKNSSKENKPQHPWADNFYLGIDNKVREELQEAASAVRLAKKVEYKTPGIFCERLKDNYKNLETITEQ